MKTIRLVPEDEQSNGGRVLEYALGLVASLEIEIVLEKFEDILLCVCGIEEYMLMVFQDEREQFACLSAGGRSFEAAIDQSLPIEEIHPDWNALRLTQQWSQAAEVRSDVYKRLGASNFDLQGSIVLPLKRSGGEIGYLEFVGGLDDTSGLDLDEMRKLCEFAGTAVSHALSVGSIRELSIKDDVSGLYNSRFLHDALEREHQRSERYKSEFSVVFMDLDYFKSVNDNHNHLVGTEILRETAALIREQLRESDIAIRYGGDEFVMILPETAKNEGVVVAQRVQDALRRFNFGKKFGLDLRLTASLGVSSYPSDAEDRTSLLEISDKAMYYVKENGRDGIATHEGLVQE